MKPQSQNYNPNENPDPTIDQTKVDQYSLMDFDINFGLIYRTPTWYVGVSGTKLLGGVRISGDKDIVKVPQQIYVSGGYIWDLKTPIPWSIEPHIMIRINLSAWQLNAIALARYNGILWFGLGYNAWGISALFGAVPFYNTGSDYLKGLEIGVAFTFPTTKIGYMRTGSWGDFELVLRYGFNFYKEKVLTGYGSSRHLYKNQY
jgi:type IX secretion system PorP/SprF family membrane protein